MSVGLVPAIGDKIGDPIDFELENGITLTWVDGWFCDFATSCAGLLVYNAGRYKCCKNWIIQRDGKQIYPKVEEVRTGTTERTVTTEECRLYRAFLRDGAIRNINNIIEHLSALIDAKIKEKMGDK